MKIKIMKSSYNGYWYANRIGQIFTATHCEDQDGSTNWVNKYWVLSKGQVQGCFGAYHVLRANAMIISENRKVKRGIRCL